MPVAARPRYDRVVISRDAVRYWMRRRKIKDQHALAEKANLEYYHLSTVINGSNFFSTTLTKLCIALQVQPSEITEINFSKDKET